VNHRKNDPKIVRVAGFGAGALLCSALLLGASAALAYDGMAESNVPRGKGKGHVYTVTITNLTYDQIISPPVVVVHDEWFHLFQPGQPAGSELAALAEDGMTGPLAGLLEVADGVFDYAVADGGIPPAGSITVEVRARGRARMLSLAGMLVSTNDAFAGVNGYVLTPGYSAETVYAKGYDAGSEVNTESCAHIPGPPCGNPGMRVTDGAEGFVHVHRGIQGVGDLDGSMKDWRNPVALVRIERN
jgi:hypothetical protein